MIPKKIHFCWFSNDPFPETVQRCMSSWNQYLPDYEIIKWDMNRIKDIDSIWLKECLSARKWAFAADFVRLWAVYNEGGIYLDSDVLVTDSFDSFLNDKMFIGREGVYYPTFDKEVKVFLTSHCFGAEIGHPFLKLCLEYYQDRHFIGSTSENIPNELRYDMLMMPYIQSTLAEGFGYDSSLNADWKQALSNGIVVYPARYFGYVRKPFISRQNYANHLGCGSWREPEFWAKQDPGPKEYTLAYKIKWRLKEACERWLAKHHYLLVKL